MVASTIFEMWLAVLVGQNDKFEPSRVGQGLPISELASEVEAVDTLREAIAHCARSDDYATRSILEEMVRSEEEHIDWIETQLETINQTGIELYLNQQIKDDDE